MFHSMRASLTIGNIVNCSTSAILVSFLGAGKKWSIIRDEMSNIRYDVGKEILNLYKMRINERYRYLNCSIDQHFWQKAWVRFVNISNATVNHA